MSREHYDQLKFDIGMINLVACTPEENRRFAEMERNSQRLPNDVNRLIGQNNYVRYVSKAPSDKEELYALMRISKDVHFFKKLIILLLILCLITIILNIVSVSGFVSSIKHMVSVISNIW